MVKQNCFVKFTATVWGDCRHACPTNAISFVEKEAAAFDEDRSSENEEKDGSTLRFNSGRVRLSFVPINAPFFDDADLLMLQLHQPMLTLTSIRILV